MVDYLTCGIGTDLFPYRYKSSMSLQIQLYFLYGINRKFSIIHNILW
jgi:hypothetical protein